MIVNLPKRRHGFAVGFTLIEVLVVVAIIALLVAILLPSLRNAREQAKLTIDKANSKQIAYAQAFYQTDSRGFMPILYNYFAYSLPVSGMTPESPPAKLCLMSVALRPYDARTRNLKKIDLGKGIFDPDDAWAPDKVDLYEDRVMPEHYACPFERGRGNGRDLLRKDSLFWYYEWRGRFESYHTWLYKWVIKNTTPTVPWPLPHNQGEGTFAYTGISLNKRGNGARSEYAARYTDHVNLKFSRQQLSDFKAAGPSEIMISFCSQGEHVQWGDSRVGRPLGRANVGSHRTGRGGGTLAIFADGRVDWILGTRIGYD